MSDLTTEDLLAAIDRRITTTSPGFPRTTEELMMLGFTRKQVENAHHDGYIWIERGTRNWNLKPPGRWLLDAAERPASGRRGRDERLGDDPTSRASTGDPT
jgi:hypothetical protein